MDDQPTIAITIDTEEDNWGSFAPVGATSTNIGVIPRLQEVLDKWQARPTYLVNHPPLTSAASVAVLGELAERESVEIGGHCHPWNTPPNTRSGIEHSMMFSYSLEENRGMIGSVTDRVKSELGITPTSFRAGRWGFGPTVSMALAEHGYTVDASISPFVDWSPDGGPNYVSAPHEPFLFDPARPFKSDRKGSMVGLPTTIGFLRGDSRRLAVKRLALKNSGLARALKVCGILDRIGVLARRWLSPEQSSTADMIALANGCVAAGNGNLDLTFHSSTLLPGATPFVRDESDQKRFFSSIDDFLGFAAGAGFGFETLRERGARIRAELGR